MPLDTILCLDSSSSMEGTGMEELKRAVQVFLDGVEETSRQTNLKENVAIVEFGKYSRIFVHLTTNYSHLRYATSLQPCKLEDEENEKRRKKYTEQVQYGAQIEAGGTTPMFNGLMLALREIIEHGGIVQVMGKPLTPRIILMTDGKPTNENGSATEKAKKNVLVVAAYFGPGWKHVGLPHPIPIACVGCGACDPDMLKAISRMTNGMFVVVEQLQELSGFFLRQVLLVRFAVKFSDDVRRLRNIAVLQQFMQEMGAPVEGAELEGLMRLLLSMMTSEALTDSGAGASQATQQRRTNETSQACTCDIL